MSEQRVKIAKAARDLYIKTISFEQFLELVPEQDNDELIDELVDLIEHEPQKGGFLGASEDEHSNFLKQIFEVIDKLEQV